ncbi:unnamed protein product [Gordionus sp. m RMFG-2023]
MKQYKKVLKTCKGKELLKDLCDVKKDGTSNMADFFNSTMLTKLKNPVYLIREWDRIVWNADLKDIFTNKHIP